jgi:hypothetical protein
MSVPASPEPPRQSLLRELFSIEQPPPQPPAVRRLRALVALTALATVVLDLINLGYADEPGFGLGVRTVWALLRALGFLFLMRAIRYGRMASRPFGLILAVTTVFAAGRLVIAREGRLVPQWPVIVAFVVLLVLCGAIVWQLYRSPVVAAHLSRRPPRRPISPWVLTARIAALSFSALLLVPCLVAAGSLLGHQRRVDPTVGVPVVVGWFVLAVLLGFLVPWVMIFVILGRRSARAIAMFISLLVLALQPILCVWLLGVDGFIRDGLPLVIVAVGALYALWRSGNERHIQRQPSMSPHGRSEPTAGVSRNDVASRQPT